MSETTEYDIGSQVSCSDGVCGELRRVVVDPVARALTHLVVEPRHRPGSGHLVPIDLVASTTGSTVQLSCTTAEFEALEDAEETQFLPGASGEWGYGQQHMLSWPYFRMGGMGMVGTSMGGLGMGGMGMGGGLGMGRMGMGRMSMGMGAGPQATTSDRIPAGEVEVRRGDHVHATDGTIGRVQGLVIDPSDHQVTHVLLDEGHLWGEKRVAVPISAVTDVKDGVRLTLSKDEVRDLPEVDIDQPE
jgi:sporulation protein YlmC with PRC-barrel domain